MITPLKAIEITTEITNNHRNNPLISDKWPFHGVFFCGVPPWENSQELERVQTLPRSRSCRITPVGGSARARPLQIDGDESRIIPGVFSIEKGCGENHRFHKGWSWKSMKIHEKSMKIYENPWKSMKNPWTSMSIHEESMKIYENPWFMDIQWYSWWEKIHNGTLCMFSYQATLSCSVWAHGSTRGFFTDLSGMS